ncbi:MAG: cytidine deaminase [Selenomonadaceae bacterium]|nr:cytidine deaminase [Selenomonadaceae bacterium]
MNFDIVDTMVRMAADAIRNSYTEHGGIAAGACVLSSDGALYSGCSVDHPETVLNYSAEVVAMLRAVSDGKREFDALAVVADIDGTYIPDEDSWMFMKEFEVEKIILADLEGDVKILNLDEIEPYKPRRRN